jgi:hypothetical protein
MVSSSPKVVVSSSRGRVTESSSVRRVTSALVWVAAGCSLAAGCFLDRDGIFTEPVDPAGGGGQGGMGPECAEPSDCPGQDEPCRIRTCANNVCGVVVLSLNTACGDNGQICDGKGSCVLPDGFGCTDPDQCLSGHCWDDVCCNQSCGGACQTCTELLGECTSHPPGTDPEMACDGGACDSAGNCAVGTTADSGRFGGSGDDGAFGVAASPDGNILVATEFESTVSIGDTFTASSRDGLVVKLDTAMNPMWARQIGGSGDEHLHAVGSDGAGNVYAAGYFDGTLSVGTDNHTTAGSDDIFVAKYDTAGVFQWSRVYGGSGSDAALDLAVSTDGTVTVVGWIGASISLDGNTTLTPAGFDLFVLRLDGAGNHIASNSWGGSGTDTALCVTSDDAGDIWVAGNMDADLSLGGNTLTYVGSDWDGWVAKFDANLAHQWSFAANATGPMLMRRIAIDPDGSGVLAADWDGSLDIQSNTRNSFDNASDIVLARLSATDGRVQQIRYFVGQGAQQASGLTADSSGNVVLFGTFDGNIDFGGGSLISAGATDVFVAKFSDNDTHLFSRRFGDNSIDEGWDVTTTSDGRIVGVGLFEGDIDFGTGLHTTAGKQDAFVVSFEP